MTFTSAHHDADPEATAAQRSPRGEQAKDLTAREKDVMVLVAAGAPNKEIAVTLHIGLSTVEAHMSHIFKKLGARNRAHAAALFVRSAERTEEESNGSN